MYKCPKCDQSIQDKYETVCPSCKGLIDFCSCCERYTERQWHKRSIRLQYLVTCAQFFATCKNCGEVLWDTVHIRKSSLYQHYRYSFKFVNRYLIPYPMYFHHQFPFGEKRADLGLCVSNFVFQEEADEQGASPAKTETSPFRGYQIAYQIGTASEECIVLSHESGLEVFPEMMATYPSRRAGKHPLHQSLEYIAVSINWWWERYKSDYWGPSQVYSFAPLVEQMVIRSSHWEFSVDDRFPPADREIILQQIARAPEPTESIEEFASFFGTHYLRDKILSTSRKIVELA